METNEEILSKLKETNELIEVIKEKVAPEYQNIETAEKEGVTGIFKHFDRIHDKLFSFNNILIAGFFALTQLDSSVSTYIIVIPLINLSILIYVEYQMMEMNRFKSNIKNIPINEIPQRLDSFNKKTTNYSLLTIISTSIVTIIFVWRLV